jgi:hypothetical protein
VDSFFIVFGGSGGNMVFSRGLCLRLPAAGRPPALASLQERLRLSRRLYRALHLLTWLLKQSHGPAARTEENRPAEHRTVFSAPPSQTASGLLPCDCFSVIICRLVLEERKSGKAEVKLIAFSGDVPFLNNIRNPVVKCCHYYSEFIHGHLRTFLKISNIIFLPVP